MLLTSFSPHPREHRETGVPSNSILLLGWECGAPDFWKSNAKARNYRNVDNSGSGCIFDSAQPSYQLLNFL